MPVKFVDNLGNQYLITLTLRKAREIQSRIPIDITSEHDWQNLAASRADQLAYIWWLVHDQASEYGLNLDSWEEAMSGKGIASGACDALMQELVNFFQRFDMPKLEAMQKCVAKGLAKEQEAWSSETTVQNLEKAMETLVSGPRSSSGLQSPELTGSP